LVELSAAIVFADRDSFLTHAYRVLPRLLVADNDLVADVSDLLGEQVLLSWFHVEFM